MTMWFAPEVDVNTSFDLSSLPVPSPAWREIFTFSDDGSVRDSVLPPGSCENVDCTVSQKKSCQFGQQRSPK